MPAANCTDPVVIDESVDNGRVRVIVQLKWDGTSTPPNCDGTINAIVWNNTGPNTWYAHFPAATKGPCCYRVDPGTSGTETRAAVFSAGGLSNRQSIFDNFDVNQNPPAQGERLLN